MARIGIIGTGWGARVQVGAFRSAGLEVVAIAGHNAEKTVRVAERLNVPRPFLDWRTLVESDELDLVSIVTPPLHHAEMTLAALNGGKHVLCEKPTAMNADEASRMLAVARQHPRQLALIDHELRFLPSWRSARQRVREIGPIRYTELRYCSPSRGNRAREWNWWSDAAAGGGILGAVGSHYVDATRYLVGEIDAVQADLHTFIATRLSAGQGSRPVTSDDFAIVHLRLADGGLAVMQLSAVASSDEPTTFTIHGEHGGVRLVGEQMFVSHEGAEWTETTPETPMEVAGNSPGGVFGSGTVHLGRALREALDLGNPAALQPAATFEDGLRQQEVLDAARRSHLNGGRWETATRQ